MKRAVIILTMIFAFGSAYANDKKVSDEKKLIKEVKAEMEDPIFYIEALEQEPDVLVYNIEGKLLHSFKRENIDPVAMRNADLLMESNSQKIFIKIKELNPTI
ncbi:MAG: hypothetical protein ACQETL_01665 [Bacteroidota bacterium]